MSDLITASFWNTRTYVYSYYILSQQSNTIPSRYFPPSPVRRSRLNCNKFIDIDRPPGASPLSPIFSRAAVRIFLAVFTPLTMVFFTSFYYSRHPCSMSVVSASILYYFFVFLFHFFISLFIRRFSIRARRSSVLAPFCEDMEDFLYLVTFARFTVTLSCAAFPPRGIVTLK